MMRVFSSGTTSIGCSRPNTWIFGEEYNLTVDDESLTEALQRHLEMLGKDDDAANGQPVVREDGRTGRLDLMLSRVVPQANALTREHLVVALGRAVVEAGHSVLFVTATTLIAALTRAHAEGKLGEQLGFYAKPKLLVIDELGYLPFEKQSANLFFQLVTRRYERGSMLITSNQMVTQWGHVFGDEMIAAVVLDRLLHHSHALIIQGDSFRLRQKKRTGLLGSSKT